MQVVEAATELLGHVADVGGEVGRLAVRAEDDPVLVVAVRRRAEPDRAVLLVDVSALAQALDRARDPALVVEARLARPDVEMDAEGLETRLDAFADATGGPSTELAVGVGAGLGRCRPEVGRQLGGEVVDVVALVAALGHRLAPPQRRDRRSQVADLTARVVEVVLARHLLPAGLEHAAREIADERAARVPDVERPGRVGRHELDIDRARTDRRDPPPAGRVGEDRRDRRFERAVAQADVEEAGRGDLGGRDR